MCSIKVDINETSTFSFFLFNHRTVQVLLQVRLDPQTEALETVAAGF